MWSGYKSRFFCSIHNFSVLIDSALSRYLLLMICATASTQKKCQNIYLNSNAIALNLHRIIRLKIVDIVSYHCNNKSYMLLLAKKKNSATTWTSINKNISDNMCTSFIYLHILKLCFGTEKPKLFPRSKDLLPCSKIMLRDHK